SGSVLDSLKNELEEMRRDLNKYSREMHRLDEGGIDSFKYTFHQQVKALNDKVERLFRDNAQANLKHIEQLVNTSQTIGVDVLDEMEMLDEARLLIGRNQMLDATKLLSRIQGSVKKKTEERRNNLVPNLERLINEAEALGYKVDNHRNALPSVQLDVTAGAITNAEYKAKQLESDIKGMMAADCEAMLPAIEERIAEARRDGVDTADIEKKLAELKYNLKRNDPLTVLKEIPTLKNMMITRKQEYMQCKYDAFDEEVKRASRYCSILQARNYLKLLRSNIENLDVSGFNKNLAAGASTLNSLLLKQAQFLMKEKEAKLRNLEDKTVDISEIKGLLSEAAGYISSGDYYKAIDSLRATDHYFSSTLSTYLSSNLSTVAGEIEVNREWMNRKGLFSQKELRADEIIMPLVAKAAELQEKIKRGMMENIEEDTVKLEQDFHRGMENLFNPVISRVKREIYNLEKEGAGTGDIMEALDKSIACIEQHRYEETWDLLSEMDELYKKARTNHLYSRIGEMESRIAMLESSGKDVKWAYDLLDFAKNAMRMGEEENARTFMKRISDGLDKEEGA
ncbi:MAG: hypothetical protein QW728_07405, partial [Thermoplasmata archaeon]